VTQGRHDLYLPGLRQRATAYSYDGNGNLRTDGGRQYSWNAENLPTQISHVSGNESYSYDADGERVKLLRGSTTTVYLEGLWDEVAGGTTKMSYDFNGQIVAVRDTSANTVTYLHADHLGSISVATNSSGAQLNGQEFDPWGKVRLGAVSQTSRNYTGQILDGSKLLYYHARMYDPGLGRFVSPDSIVPGQSDTAGTANPQDLNRYSYVDNNPLKNTDPSGHCIFEPLEAIVCVALAAEAAEVVVTAIAGKALIAGVFDNLIVDLPHSR
jgi:RHS repeat-associated protein